MIDSGRIKMATYKILDQGFLFFILNFLFFIFQNDETMSFHALMINIFLKEKFLLMLSNFQARV